MAGVYISYPFCAQKCSFCNFASGVGRSGERGRYHEALLREMQKHQWNWTPETVYIGGGTPSLASAEFLDRLLAEMPGESVEEITLECAPGTIAPDVLPKWRQAGINRVSLGVQSFVEQELRLTGRRHTAKVVARDVADLRAAGIGNINLDLIAGLPEQTLDSWEVSLEWIQRLAPPLVSVYLFEADDDSRLGKELGSGGVRYGAGLMPSDDRMAEFYERAVERLGRMGIERYEISNFAAAGCESRHNLKYWRLEPYVGFGLDAHSFDCGRRWANPDSLETYLDEARSTPEASDTDSGEEHFFVGLRLEQGIEPSEREWLRFATPIEKWVGLGMLKRDGARLRLSAQGVLLSNEIFAEFLSD